MDSKSTLIFPVLVLRTIYRTAFSIFYVYWPGLALYPFVLIPKIKDKDTPIPTAKCPHLKCYITCLIQHAPSAWMFKVIVNMVLCLRSTAPLSMYVGPLYVNITLSPCDVRGFVSENTTPSCPCRV